MSFYLDWPDYVVFVFLLIIYASIGIFYGYSAQIKSLIARIFKKGSAIQNNANTTEDMFLGNRQLTLFPIIGSTLASFLSAVALMGNNAEVYLYGIEFWLLILGYIIAFPVAAEVYTPVFYNLRLTSAHEYLELRFSRLVRWLVTLTFEFQMLIYMAVVLYAPSLALNRVTGWPLYASILSTGILATFYTALGGIKAVVWTDLIQVTVMLGGLLCVLAFGTNQSGGIAEVWRIAGEGGRLNILDLNPDPFVRQSTWTLVIGGAGMVLSIYATNQTQVQRYLACKDLKTARQAIHANLGFNSLFLSIQMLCGLVSYAVFVGCDPLLDGHITAYDQIFPHLVMHLFQNIPVLRGIFLSTIFAAALSTLSSGINGIACVLVEDVFLDAYLRFNSGKKMEQKQFLLFARLLAVLLGLIIVGLAFLLKVVPAGVLTMAFSIFGAVGGPILTIFTLGILFPFVNKWGALFGFLGSLASGMGMALGGIFAYTYKEYVAVPLTNASCPLGSPPMHLNTTAPPRESYEWSFFNLSSFYYTPLCLLVGIIISFPVSICTGGIPEKLAVETLHNLSSCLFTNYLLVGINMCILRLTVCLERRVGHSVRAFFKKKKIKKKKKNKGILIL
uniref:Sodium-coupled monocarboxylate transporter 1 n=1 Tax=Schistocephalus solidus TaxID=70667 RepID=A0A0X3PGT5_SCHSO